MRPCDPGGPERDDDDPEFTGDYVVRWDDGVYVGIECAICGRRRRETRPTMRRERWECPHCALMRAGTYHVDLRLRWGNDPEAQRFVEDHPHGATCEQIARACNVTRQRIHAIEREAMQHIKRRVRLVGLEP